MNKLQSLIFYLSIFALSCIFANLSQLSVRANVKLNERKSKNIVYYMLLLISIGFPIITSGIRYNVGVDYNSYQTMYYNITNASFIENIRRGELGYTILNKLSKIIFNSPQGVFLLSSIITLCFLYAAISEYEKKISFSLTLFLYYTKFYAFSLNVMRQSIAISIVMYSYKFIQSKNLKKFLFWIIVASTFHTSALMIIPFYFINGKMIKKSLLIKIVSVFICTIITLNIDVILSKIGGISIMSRYLVYSQLVNTNSISFSSFLSQIVIILFMVLFWRRLIKTDERLELYFWFYIFGVILTLADIKIQYIGRIGMYFEILSIILIPYIVSVIRNKIIRKAAFFSIIIYGLAVFIAANYISNVQLIMPFKVFWKL